MLKYAHIFLIISDASKKEDILYCKSKLTEYLNENFNAINSVITIIEARPDIIRDCINHALPDTMDGYSNATCLFSLFIFCDRESFELVGEDTITMDHASYIILDEAFCRTLQDFVIIDPSVEIPYYLLGLQYLFTKDLISLIDILDEQTYLTVRKTFKVHKEGFLSTIPYTRLSLYFEDVPMSIYMVYPSEYKEQKRVLPVIDLEEGKVLDEMALINLFVILPSDHEFEKEVTVSVHRNRKVIDLLGDETIKAKVDKVMTRIIKLHKDPGEYYDLIDAITFTIPASDYKLYAKAFGNAFFNKIIGRDPKIIE